jgi:ribosomal protein L29
MKTGAVSAGAMAERTGQSEIRAAEVKEAEVRLAQAKRRLARLTGQADPARKPQGPTPNQRVEELEKRLDALKKELDGLRKDLGSQRPPGQ